MRVKWNGQTFDIKNEIENSTKDFFCTWNHYTIQITYDKWMKKHFEITGYDAWCYDPKGGACVDGAAYPTISKALQGCFDNIYYPLVSINDPDEEELE